MDTNIITRSQCSMGSNDSVKPGYMYILSNTKQLSNPQVAQLNSQTDRDRGTDTDTETERKTQPDRQTERQT